MGTDDLKFRGVVKCKEVKEGKSGQNLALLCCHAVVSGETQTAKLAGLIAAGPKVVGKCDLQD